MSTQSRPLTGEVFRKSWAAFLKGDNTWGDASRWCLDKHDLSVVKILSFPQDKCDLSVVLCDFEEVM